jgi:3-oxoacyl-[acyl-carrier-protein] synthase-3
MNGMATTYTNVTIAGLGYELPPNVVSSEDLEDRLKPLYRSLHLQTGQLEILTGVRERRYWDPGFAMSEGAARAARKALAAACIDPQGLGMVIYAGVCRDNLEPATACAVADRLGVGSSALVFDLSNACLGVVNGMVLAANAIGLGQIDAALVVSCESAREIVDSTMHRMQAAGDMETFKKCLATLTGGSGAAAVVVAAADRVDPGRRVIGAYAQNAVRHHRLCRWGPDTGIPATGLHSMETDAASVLRHGAALGQEAFNGFMEAMGWGPDKPDKIVCHQVGAAHQRTILEAIGVPATKDFTTFQYLGNMGTVSLPLTAAVAAERGFLQPGDHVGLLGIGSGLNCLLVGVAW